MNWTAKEPKFGDIIRRKVTFYYHYGIFVSEASVIQFGLPDAPTKQSEEIEVLETDIYTFLQDSQLEVGVPEGIEKKNIFSAKKRVENAKNQLGAKGYDILHNNCEHFVNRCAFGESKSSFWDNVREKIRHKLEK